jgi:hypothetical protein
MTHDPLADWFGRAAPAGDEAPADLPDRAAPPAPWAADDERGSGDAGTRRRVLFALAAVPWVAVAVLVVALARPEAAPGEAPATAHEAASALAAVDVPPPPALEVAHGEHAAGAGAVLHVRAAVSTGAGADPVRYVDTAAVERVEELGEVTIVSVVAMVLEGSAERWTSAAPRRYAVALRDGRPLADPWPLPGPELEPRAVAWDPVDDADLAAAAMEALADAGYDTPVPPSLAGASELPDVLRATFDGTAPSERAPAEHTVLLRRVGTGLGVLGHAHDITVPTPEEMP